MSVVFVVQYRQAYTTSSSDAPIKTSWADYNKLIGVSTGVATIELAREVQAAADKSFKLLIKDATVQTRIVKRTEVAVT